MRYALIWLLSLTTYATNFEPLPPPEVDTSRWGENIQRTMSLLAESSPEKRYQVRILFYGQSIMGGNWHGMVERHLRSQFPHADLILENRAIGGFSTSYLIRTMEYDLYRFQPDLLIFRVAGGQDQYEQIIFNARQRTATEVMILNTHYRVTESETSEKWVMPEWERFFDRLVIPSVVRKYEADFVDIRRPWKSYILQNELEIGDLVVSDGVHLNDHGRFVYAELCNRQLLYRPELMTEASKNLVQDFEMGDEISWNGEQLDFEFNGVRVDIIPSGAGRGTAEIWIDGQRPSENDQLFTFTRPNGLIDPYEWPSIWRMGNQTLRVAEDWTVEILEIDDSQTNFRFSVNGSRSGFDGTGSSSEDFVSNSGRLTINSDDWGIKRAFDLRGEKVVPGMQIRFSTEATHVDAYRAPDHLEPNLENAVTLFHGLENKKHRLRLRVKEGEVPPIKALRVYRPMIEAGAFKPLGLTPDMPSPDFSKTANQPTPQSGD